MEVTIHHNPRCGTSRRTLDLIRQAGIEPRVVEYLKTPPSHAELRRLLHEAGLRPRDALRAKETAYAELGLDNPAMSDDDLHGFLGDLVSAAMGRWQSDPEVPDRIVLAAVEKACAQWRTPGQGYRSDEAEQ